MPVGAAVGIGSVVTAGASLAGSRAQAQSADRAADLQYQATQEARADLAPFRQAGESVLGDLVTNARQNPFDLDFTRQEGFRDIQNSAAAAGKLRSGGTLAELARYNAGITSSFNMQQNQKLQNLAALGSNAAGGQATASIQGAGMAGNALMQSGNAQAAGLVGVGNAINDGISNYLYLRGP